MQITRTLLAPLLACAVAVAQGDAPSPAQPHLEAAQARLQQQDYAGAVEHFGKAIEADPASVAARLGRAFARQRLGEHAAAIEDLDAAMKLEAPPAAVAQIRLMRGLSHHVEGHYRDALEDYDAAAETMHNNADLYLRRAQVRDVIGDLSGAIEDYTRVTVLATDFAGGYLGRAQNKRELGDRQGAREDLEAVFFLDPDGTEGYRLKARLAMDEDDLQAAREALDTALAKADEDTKAWAHFSRGLALYDMGRPGEAVADFRKALELDAENSEYARFYLYLARAAQGEEAEAAAELKAYLDARETKDDWYAEVVRYLTGAQTADELLEAAKADDEVKTNQHRCEAHWYIAAKALLAGETERAAKHLDACLAEKQHHFIEYESARWAKERLGS